MSVRSPLILRPLMNIHQLLNIHPYPQHLVSATMNCDPSRQPQKFLQNPMTKVCHPPRLPRTQCLNLLRKNLQEIQHSRRTTLHTRAAKLSPTSKQLSPKIPASNPTIIPCPRMSVGYPTRISCPRTPDLEPRNPA